ncbi:MAG: hypothetical protein JW702_03815 [Clostridiales bacterium]|nr:hypothetical protein [Clostridiales bacterium]
MIEKIKELFNKTKLSRNTTPKMISLIFAIVLWIYVMDQVNPEIIKEYNDIKVEIVGVEQLSNEGLIMLSGENQYVTIKVQGRRNDLLSFDENYLVITADIRGYQKGLNTVPIDKRVLVDSVSIVDISKSEIKVELDKIVSQQKVVRVDRTGTVDTGYELGNFTQSKAEVIVKGPETLVSRVTEVTGELSVSGIQNDYQTEVSLIPVDYDGNQVLGVDLSANSVLCSFETFKLRTVPIEYKLIGELPQDYKLVNVLINPATVVVKGKPEIVNVISKVETLEIDLTDRMEGFEIDLNLILPEGVDTPYLENAIKGNLTIEKMETKEFTFNISGIPIINLSANNDIVIIENNKSVNLIIKDIRSKLDSISRSDIELVLDVSNLFPGKYSVPIEIVTEETFDEFSLSQDKIDLEIIIKQE